MTMTTGLTPMLKHLKLGPMAATLPERIALARREQLDYASFLEIILSDEINRRAHRRIETRLHQAGFQEICRLEDFALRQAQEVGVHHPGPPAPQRRLLLGIPGQARACAAHRPAGVGKSFLAQALGSPP